MEKIKEVKHTYGVKKGKWKGKDYFFVVSDEYTCSTLKYKRYNFTLDKSEAFIKSCYPKGIVLDCLGKKHFHSFEFKSN